MNVFVFVFLEARKERFFLHLETSCFFFPLLFRLLRNALSTAGRCRPAFLPFDKGINAGRISLLFHLLYRLSLSIYVNLIALKNSALPLSPLLFCYFLLF